MNTLRTNPGRTEIDTETYPSFLKLSPADTVSEEFDEDFYVKGQTVFSEGNTPHGLYFVKSGRVKVFRFGGDGKEQILTIASGGKFLGYKDLLAKRRYSTSAMALEDSVLLFIPKQDFFRIFNSSEGSGFFINLLCKDLVEAERKMVSLAYTPVRGRLAEGLLELKEAYQDHEHKIELSREDLANFIGTAKETVIRLLSEFKSEHLINIQGKYIEVINPGGLDRLNNLYN
ncbi:Crp/Fnr family transcriptional regulator [Roseivirga sp.]|uniref:Crp/Fnr family transcriptional regulator n=1 Tax=Roseivirga sp. TaxID=1964215 RepID=UPI003B51C206